MSQLVENIEDLPTVDRIPMMIILMLHHKKETTYTRIDQSNIAKYEFIPKESISEIKRKGNFKDPVSSRWTGMIF